MSGHFHDVSKEAIKHKMPSEVLTMHLENAQLAHRQCLVKAAKDNADPVDRCSLTWGEVYVRYQAWAAYREPFKVADSEAKYAKKWTKKAEAAYQKRVEMGLV